MASAKHQTADRGSIMLPQQLANGIAFNWTISMCQARQYNEQLEGVRKEWILNNLIVFICKYFDSNFMHVEADDLYNETSTLSPYAP